MHEALARSLKDNRDYHAGRYLRSGRNPRLGFPVLLENLLAFVADSFLTFSRERQTLAALGRNAGVMSRNETISTCADHYWDESEASPCM